MSYSFPLLQPKEVIQCLQELGLEFTEAQLLKPEFEPVAKLFENIVLLVMGVTRWGPGTEKSSCREGTGVGSGRF